MSLVGYPLETLGSNPHSHISILLLIKVFESQGSSTKVSVNVITYVLHDKVYDDVADHLGGFKNLR